VQQFRAPVFFCERQEQTLEAIAGIVEDPDPATTVRREAVEEAGLRLDTLEYVMSGWTMPGISTERLHCYLAPYDERSWISGGAGVESDEQVTPVEMTLGELTGMADAGRLVDVKSLLLLQTLRLRRPSLFGR
jgi:8-oxo-dGTP pyrophosphatase MutT (NUDIX family)